VKKKSCSTCANWAAPDEARGATGDWYTCYGVPPQPCRDADGDASAVWPVTSPHDRCLLWTEHNAAPRLDPEHCSGCAMVKDSLQRLKTAFDGHTSHESIGAAFVIAYLRKCLDRGTPVNWSDAHDAVLGKEEEP